jgi:hypothetical protein
VTERTPKARVVEPNRRQGVIRFERPEDVIPLEHTVRVLDRVVGTLDLGAFTAGVKAFEGEAELASRPAFAAGPALDAPPSLIQLNETSRPGSPPGVDVSTISESGAVAWHIFDDSSVREEVYVRRHARHLHPLQERGALELWRGVRSPLHQRLGRADLALHERQGAPLSAREPIVAELRKIRHRAEMLGDLPSAATCCAAPFGGGHRAKL